VNDDIEIILTTAQLYVCGGLVAAALIGVGLVLGRWIWGG
jgi:hypothetical protein